MFGFVQKKAILCLDLCKIRPPRIHRPNGNMHPVMLLGGETHYFTYFRLSKRTILHIYCFQNALFYKLCGIFADFCLFCEEKEAAEKAEIVEK